MTNLIGKTIRFDVFNPLDTAISEPVAKTVKEDTVEFPNTGALIKEFSEIPDDIQVNGEVGLAKTNVDINKNQIKVNFDEEEGGTFVSSQFNGYQFTDSRGNIAPIKDVSIAEDQLGLTQSDITHTRDTIRVNLEGLPFQDNSTIKLNVETESQSEGPSKSNLVVLNGADQTIDLSFDAQVVGTAAAEKIQVEQGTQLAGFSGGSGDTIAFADALSTYDLSTSGNQLTLSNQSTEATVSLNGETSLAFADGGTTANITAGSSGVEITVGGQTVGPNFDPGAISLDPNQATTFGSDDSGDGGNNTGSQSFPSLPSQGGPSAVSSGTAASENINGNQSATVSGNGGQDRFIFDTGSSADLTVDDFANGDQLFFNVDQLGTIGVTNTTFDDGQVTLSAGQAAVTLTNLSDTADQLIFDTASFETQFGSRGIGILGEPGGTTAGTSSSLVADDPAGIA